MHHFEYRMFLLLYQSSFAVNSTEKQRSPDFDPGYALSWDHSKVDGK
jgi:hypothetical protein